MEKQVLKGFCTKYALTQGIFPVDVETTDGMYFYTLERFRVQLTSREFFVDYEDAVKDAESRRVKKIQALEKQITKLQKLKFL